MAKPHDSTKTSLRQKLTERDVDDHALLAGAQARQHQGVISTALK